MNYKQAMEQITSDKRPQLGRNIWNVLGTELVRKFKHVTPELIQDAVKDITQEEQDEMAKKLILGRRYFFYEFLKRKGLEPMPIDPNFNKELDFYEKVGFEYDDLTLEEQQQIKL